MAPGSLLQLVLILAARLMPWCYMKYEKSCQEVKKWRNLTGGFMGAGMQRPFEGALP
jgi:hypothetical protein